MLSFALITSCRFDNAAILIIVVGSLVIVVVAGIFYWKVVMPGSVDTRGTTCGGKHIGSVTEARPTDVELRMSDGGAISNPMVEEGGGYIYED